MRTPLTEDATLGLERLVTDPSSVRFLGSIISVQGVAREIAPPPLDRELPRRVITIIDGQQRICTIMVLNVLFHDALARLVGALEDSDDPGVASLREEARDFLDELSKTFQFQGRGSQELYRLYPRVVRALEDTWARTAAHANYTSPIARFVWSYIEFRYGPDDGDIAEEFEYDGLDAHGDPIAGHEALLAAIESLREQINQLAKDEHETLSIPAIEDIVRADGHVVAELWPNPLTAPVLEFLENKDADDDFFDECQQVVRLLALARYVNFRLAATVIDASKEDYAFDMFEALNTTGQPLTAFETFKPRVIEFEGAAGYPASPTKEAIDRVQDYLDRFRKAEERLSATSTLLIPFALAESGRKLEKHLSQQRRYLRDQFDAAATRPAKRAFVKNLATTATFVGSAWRPRSARISAALIPGDIYSDDNAAFCLEALRSIRHEIVLAPLSRFFAAYEAAAANERAQTAEDLFGAVKAITAFSMIWRAAKGGTANIDSVYRDLMLRGIGGFPAMKRQAGVDVSLTNLKAALAARLVEEGITRASWVREAGQAPIYKVGQNITRFLLIAASHDAVPEGHTGLIEKGRRGSNPLLTRDHWIDDDMLTVEHVAPNAAHGVGWPEDVYDDSRTIQRLGNFVLLPQLENNILADRGWAEKRILYRMFGADRLAAARQALADGRAIGFNPGNRAAELVEEAKVLPMCQAISTFAGPWDTAFIGRRSTRLAELAWDTIYPWISSVRPRPLARRRGRR
ncbi:GmrSD restriction endonuclease domain-containing protein [Novosphingobium album (ex Liu et al. 2023)]|uniref:GmrSD restriction endonuclease domain-containing protein n=1 Tax=Novosphingobium album (ex Liu et al. 2023) TaxID=3031130 RepID=UPI0023B15A85|nr:DUF262 domain-containing protein [Novosphingobium album (ex Liu et al. 2023)]